MILVLILLIIFILLLLFIFLIVISTLKIEVKDLFVSNIEKNFNAKHPYEESIKQQDLNSLLKEQEDQMQNYSKKQIDKIIFSLSLGRCEWLKISLNQKRIKSLYTKMHLERIDIKKLEQDFKLEDLKIFPKLKPKISYLNLQASFGLKSPITTAFTVASVASVISILLSQFAKEWKKENYQYNIIPIYLQKKLYQINFNCIIEFKMVHIINVIYIFVKKGKSDKNERTTSNRKSYGYSYE